MSTKRERIIRLEGQLEREKRRRSDQEIIMTDIDKQIKKIENAIDKLKHENQHAIPIEDVIKRGGWGEGKKNHLIQLNRKYWGNGINKPHLTLKGRPIFDVVCEEIDGIDDSNAAVYLNVPSLMFTVIELTDGWESKVKKLDADPNAVQLFSK
jgi:hypothetical protein